MGDLPQIGATIILRDEAPPLLAAEGAIRPVRSGRAGLFVLLTDGTTREITYDDRHHQQAAIEWVLASARVGADQVAAVCAWATGELEEQERRDGRARQRGAAADAELRRLLGG